MTESNGHGAHANGQVLLEQGRLGEARERFWRDASEAERGDEAEALARAALGLGGMWVHEHRPTLERSQVTALQRRALHGLDPAAALAHRLRVRLAAEHAYTAGHAQPVLRAVDDARRRADPVVLAEALSLLHHCLLGPHFGADRMAAADELIEVAASTGRAVDASMGLMWRTIDLFLAGDRCAGRGLRELRDRLDVDRCDSLAYVLAALDVMLAIRAGRLDDAERAAEACHVLGQRVGDADALGWYGAQLIAIRWLQGRGAELLPLLRDLAHSPLVPEQNVAFSAATAVLAADAGDHATARAALASVRAGGLRTMRPSSVWLVTLFGVCEAAHLLADVDAAHEAYDLLAPFAHLPVMVSLAVACFGSAHRPLGLAARTMGDLDLAVRHLEAAAAADLRLDNGPLRAVNSATLADILEQRDAPGDPERARELRGAAIDAGCRFGMPARVQEWRSRITVDTAPPEVMCRRDGRVWRLQLGDRAVVVPDSRGMRYLAELVQNRGTAIPAIDLASGYALSDRDSWQPILDSDAGRAYRERIVVLQEEIDDADRDADLGRAAWARAELDQLVDELAAATGLSGQARSFGHDAERARISVHKAIKRALASITEAEPELGREVRARVVTGARCVFREQPTG